MSYYIITQEVSGHVFGTYQGANEAEALDAYARDAGYSSFAAACADIQDDPPVAREATAPVVALAKHLGCDASTIEEQSYDRYTSTEEPGEYRVLTSEEADTAQRDYWTSYPEDTGMFDKWPEDAINYFDKERWVEAQIVTEDGGPGRGGSLASYDGDEHEVRLDDGTYYYVYRIG